jgi:ribonuclease HII
MVIVGIDEVGRGCWAGPLVAGAVILAQPIEGLKDSKLLSKIQREKLAKVIYEQAQAVGLGWVDAATIDEHGLTRAVSLAMHQAVAQITDQYDRIIVDGNYNFLEDNPKAVTLIKADQSVMAVSAASIIAKVARDRYMAGLPAEYAEYGFDKHVGYGTALHLEKLKLHGVSDLHRRSFKPIIALLQ